MPAPQDRTGADAPLQAGYETASPAAPSQDVLARIRFGTHTRRGSDPRELMLALPILAGDEYVEVWRSAQPVQYGWEGEIGYAQDTEILFFQVLLDESSQADLEAASAAAYARLLEFLEAAGYPHLLRVWNYFPDINRGEGDTERYRQFCAGRGRVLELAPGFEPGLPAATVIGTQAPGLVVYGLAAREPGLQIENPRQVSAFRYPRQYGVRSPAFSRARLKQWGARQHLYVSGTASVVGHETRHPHAALAQLGEAVRNLEALMEQASRTQPGLPVGRLSDLDLFKVYVRPGVDPEPLQAMLQGLLGRQTRYLLLAGDICRSDLLVEIEGLYTATAAGGEPK